MPISTTSLLVPARAAARSRPIWPRAGFKVLLLEAGGDPCSEDETGPLMYEVPIFHGLSTEYKDCAWNYFVRHYTRRRAASQGRKESSCGGKDTVWYPRAGTLGGCTAHNAMITVMPQDSDWNYIASITGDDSSGARPACALTSSGLKTASMSDPGFGAGQLRMLVFPPIAELLGAARRLARSVSWPWLHGWLPTSEADPSWC